MGGTNCYIAYVLGDGSTKGSFQFNDGFPTGFGQHFVDFLKRNTPEEVEKLTNKLDTINWVEEEDSFELKWKDHYKHLDYQYGYLFYEKKISARISNEARPLHHCAEEDIQDLYRKRLTGNRWRNLLAAFRGRHSEAWEPIISGDLHHLVLYHYFKVDDNRDYCYYIDFRKRTLEIEFFKGGYAFASFDALLEDPHLLERIEESFEKKRWDSAGELDRILQNLRISKR